MTITFKGVTNDKDVWIDDISFQTPSGECIVIDRTITQYIIEDRQLTMTWRGCYVLKLVKDRWAHDYTIKASDLKGAIPCNINILLDAPHGYFIKITEWKVEDS